MAALSLLRLTQCSGLLYISKVPHKVPGRNISKKKLLNQLNIPEQPKRPPTTFVLFLQEIRDDLKKKDTLLSTEELMKKAALLWKNLSPDKKEKYQMKFKALREKYFEDVEKFEANLTPEQKVQLESFRVHYQNIKEMQAALLMRKGKEKELNKPKHPTPPFVRFVEDVKVEGSALKDVWKGAKEKWEQLPVRVKDQYKSRFRDEMNQYKKELDVWEEKMILKGHTDIVRVKTLKKKIIK